ncbi:dephospho-CoA kinase [Clostridium punense]|uniref:Dephospho-CoA kinase n=1 Tax=Clostridium punense TaxID=1054297 RepID=A0ABS4K5T6_9CLOT|nr:dephospho-CoA kinase [Clostridium punense]MBP2023142.1 dephospho-CoA kinase [Clostridium punense]
MKQSSNIFLVGLTGNIGSGKSTVSNYLKEKGISVIDADVISREVMINHPDILTKIKLNFGDECFDQNGTLIRKKLGNIIFANQEKKNKLEEIIIPYIIKDIFAKVKEYADKGIDLCVVDAPTLIENNLHFYMNAIILVTVGREIQLKRVMERDSLSLKEATIRIDAQMKEEHKLKYADFVIKNDGTKEHAKKQLEEILILVDNFRGKDGEKKEPYNLTCANSSTSYGNKF